MTNKIFEQLVTERHRKQLDQLFAKGIEYSSKTDRLHNFYRIAELTRLTPEQVALVLMAKNFISMVDAIADGTPVDQAWIDEKIGDPDNYLLLLEGLLQEKYNLRSDDEEARANL